MGIFFSLANIIVACVRGLYYYVSGAFAVAIMQLLSYFFDCLMGIREQH